MPTLGISVKSIMRNQDSFTFSNSGPYSPNTTRLEKIRLDNCVLREGVLPIEQHGEAEVGQGDLHDEAAAHPVHLLEVVVAVQQGQTPSGCHSYTTG